MGLGFREAVSIFRKCSRHPHLWGDGEEAGVGRVRSLFGCNTVSRKAPADPSGSFEDRMAFQSCPELGQRVFLSP